jgi:hypothetical protein
VSGACFSASEGGSCVNENEAGGNRNGNENGDGDGAVWLGTVVSGSVLGMVVVYKGCGMARGS